MIIFFIWQKYKSYGIKKEEAMLPLLNDYINYGYSLKPNLKLAVKLWPIL